MCRPTACKKCGKTTWAGCGMHVDQVMRNVPKDLRCKGHENDPVEPGTGLFGWLRRKR